MVENIETIGVTEKITEADMEGIFSPEQTAMKLYVQSVSTICQPNEAIIEDNINSIDKIPHDDDRKISMTSIVFVSRHIGSILCMLALDYDNMITTFANALDAEIMIDDLPDDKRLEFRKSMGDKFLNNNIDSIILGITMPSTEIFSEMFIAAGDNMIALSDSSVMGLLQERLEIADNDYFKILSIITSNCIYLLRAFSHNNALFDKVRNSVIEFESKYEIK